MTFLRLFCRDCVYYRKPFLALAAGAALISAILTGALLIGDSVRGTLHDRVNRNAAILSERLIFPFPVETCLTGGVLHAEGVITISDHLTTKVQLYARASETNLHGRDALASPALAKRLGLKPGDRMSVLVAARSAIASESLMGRPPKLKQLQLLFQGVCTNNYVEVAFANPQEEVLNIFLPHALLADALDVRPTAVNEVWQQNPSPLDDETIWALSQLVMDTWEGSPVLKSHAFFLPKHVRDRFPAATAGLFSFAESFSNETAHLDYCFIGAFEKGPFAVARGTAALADTLPETFPSGAELTYYVTEGCRKIVTRSHTFPTVTKIDDHAFGEALRPDIPGLTDVDDCSLWDAGIPVDFKRVTKADEDYWDRYRSKPKLYLNFEEAQTLFGFDTCNLLIFPKGTDPVLLRREVIQAMRSMPGLFRREAVADALRQKIDNGVSFASLFLGLSLFLIVSALLTLAMLLRLHWQDRAESLDVLRTYLTDRRRLNRFLQLEILAVTLPGAALGLLLGCGLCSIQLLLLERVWNGIVNMERLMFHARSVSFLIAFLAMVLTGLLITRWSLRENVTRLRFVPLRLHAFPRTLRQLAWTSFLRKLPEHRFCLILLALGFLGTLGVGGFGIKARGEDGFGRRYVAETQLSVVPSHDAPFPDGLLPIRVREADRADCANLLLASLPTVYGCNLHDLTGETSFLNDPFGAAVDVGSLQWIIKKNVGDSISYPEGELKIERPLKASVFQRGVLIDEAAFQKLFPEVQGARFFLIRDDAALAACRTYLEPYCPHIRSVDDFMAEAEAFQNRYLAIFLQLGILGFLLGLGAFLILMFRNKQAAQPYFRHLEMIGFSQRDTKRLFKMENQILYLSAAIPALLVLLLLAAFAPIHLPTVLIGWVLLTTAGLVVVEMR